MRRSSSGFNGRRPEKPRFPAIWSMRLAKEGSRRKLGRLSSFGCGGFEIRGAELADSGGDGELAQTPSMASSRRRRRRRRGAGGSEVGGELGRGAWSTWSRSTAGKLGSASTTATTQRWGLREASAPLLRRAAQGDGWWVYDRWGPRVRKFLYFNPNFWIVTILPPKRNLVPRFRRKVPNRKEVGNYIPWYNWSNSGYLD